MIRIAYVIDFIDRPMGGTERQLELLIRSLDRERYRPYLICLKPTPWQEENARDLNIVTSGTSRFRSPRTYLNILRLASLLRREGIDIVQTQSQDGNLVGTLAGVLSGRRIVSTRRGNLYWPSRSGQVRLRMLDRFACCFLANSEASARRLMEMEKVPARKVRVIYNGTPYLRVPQPTAAERAALLIRHGCDPMDTHIVAVGNLRPVKRHDILLRAAREVLEQFPRTRFLIVGEGSLREALSALAEREGIVPAVRFLGDQPEVLPILQASDIGVLCSDSESLPNAVIEYMVAGLPVVCTDTGGNPELVREGVNGFLVPRNAPRAVADRLGRLLGNRAEAVRMGAESRRLAESNFAVETMVGRTCALYDELAAPARR